MARASFNRHLDRSWLENLDTCSLSHGILPCRLVALLPPPRQLHPEQAQLLDAAGMVERSLPPGSVDPIAQVKRRGQATVALAMTILQTANLLGVGVSEVEEMIKSRSIGDGESRPEPGRVAECKL